MEVTPIGPIGSHILCEEIHVSRNQTVLRCASDDCSAFEDFTPGNEIEHLWAIRQISGMKCNVPADQSSN